MGRSSMVAVVSIVVFVVLNYLSTVTQLAARYGLLWPTDPAISKIIGFQIS